MNVEVAMEALGINWGLLLSQIAVCLAIPLVIVLASFVVRGKKSSKALIIFIGFLTAWVTIYSVTFGLVWVSIFVFSISNPSAGFETVFAFYNSVKVLSMITVLLIILLIAYYISHAAKSPLLSDKERIRYQAGFLFLPVVVMPIYYLKFIKNESVLIQEA